MAHTAPRDAQGLPPHLSHRGDAQKSFPSSRSVAKTLVVRTPTRESAETHCVRFERVAQPTGILARTALTRVEALQ